MNIYTKQSEGYESILVRPGALAGFVDGVGPTCGAKTR